jgi:hypothetical protein
MSQSKSLSTTLIKRTDRSLRLSSKEGEDLGVAKIKSILQNNKYFPHLYDPYFERKDIKANLLNILKTEDHRSKSNVTAGYDNPYAEKKSVQIKSKLEKNHFMKGRYSTGCVPT